ncbi:MULTISPECIES: L-serine ammonia-lyase [unclassified Agarivorans]|uniref:L-serine ammonia-lyase n=1 Tax=unclassified Agarivorans TaxID=2636026 RepID=UPI0026E26985|nr:MULTISPECIES: L-serine ammonia-lyase [unclassified Agarivorans]MDO6684547.1 L-serine ammonia-lyase [Agarivorans sp. 3_MG-2023]MDO6714712.1 L-serine ammonia-lyase [Agarivorans sp. 2_MG-2023]
MLSIFDVFKVGIGPSSSHTVGPMIAAHNFIQQLTQDQILEQVDSITVDVYGSLSLTGKGHHTDTAIIMGLAGNLPHNVDIDAIAGFVQHLEKTAILKVANNQHQVAFPAKALTFHSTCLPLHENGMVIHAWQGNLNIKSITYYSTGGGFVVEEQHFGQTNTQTISVPFPYNSAASLLEQCRENGMSISGLVRANERAFNSQTIINQQTSTLWQTMSQAIDRGCKTEGILAGPLRVPRRAASLLRQLKGRGSMSKDPMDIIDWVNLFALAVSEENAAGGRVVTAPTNGAAGIIPAVLAYYNKFIEPLNEETVQRFLMCSGAIGILYKTNASVSGAEVGCQGEVGVACSMAAAGLAELLGGSPMQVCEAAEIGMEHNLGLTCDPVAGQVQVPCIERNAIAAVKAINSSRMALRRTNESRVSLDRVIETMYATGKDMNAKYRETSQGGLAIKVAMTCS